MAINDKNYSGFVKLYTNPDTQTGYVGTMYFQILTKYGSARIRVWSEGELLNATWNISIKEGTTTWGTSGYLYQGELTEIDITEQRPNSNHYDEWEISVSAFESDDIGNLLYSGNYTKVLAKPNKIYGVQVSENHPHSKQTITVSWRLATSTNNDEFPIQGAIIRMHSWYHHGDMYSWHVWKCFPNNVTIGNTTINGILCSADMTSCQIDLSTLNYNETHGSTLCFSILSFLYWEEESNNTEDYMVTPIFSESNVGTPYIYITMINESSFVLYVKDVNGRFLLGETMFIKNANGNWRQAETIQQN